MGRTEKMYYIRHNDSHIRKMLTREDTIKYIETITGDRYNLGKYITVSSEEYDITATLIEEGKTHINKWGELE